jgi:DNA-binding beta-propeller fold protein YncE
VSDLPGTYIVSLLVNDGTINNSTTNSTVTITVNLLSPRFAYVANEFDDTVSMYIVDTTTGQLRHNGDVAAGNGPVSVTVDPFGRFAYVANTGNLESPSNISGYTISASSGALTPIPGSPSTRTEPFSVTVDPSGRFVYVANANFNSSTISGYTITASSGALTPVPGSPFVTGPAPTSVTVDPSGRFAYVANFTADNTSGTISGYTINVSSGALTPIPGALLASGLSPFSVTVDPSGRFAYVTHRGSNNISGYTITATTGALTPIAGSPFPAQGRTLSG